MHSTDFDYIITGGGCAGLSLAMHMIASGKFSQKKVLLVEKEPVKVNDRTWCFWQSSETLFENIVSKKWNRLAFYSDQLALQWNIEPYCYKLIRGIDFYDYCHEQIRKQSNFSILHGKVDHIFSSDDATGIVIDGRVIYSQFIFNSILFGLPALSSKEYWLKQHFKGWIIRAPEAVFDEHTAVLMDFRVEQSQGTAFCYLLPLSPDKALVEFTVFSKELLADETYNKQLHAYISDQWNISSYEIMEEEFGVIPMTNFRFAERQNNIINIGTAGGQTKGSSGYTFQFIQKQSRAIVESLANYDKPITARSAARFLFYDSVLLNILQKGTYPGDKIFTELFKKNKPLSVLKFLDNETSYLEEIKILASLPVKPFFKAAVDHLF